MKKQIKNKRFYRLFLVLAFLFATTLTSSNLISATYAEQEIEYAVDIAPVLNLTVPTNAISLNLHPGTNAFDSRDLNIKVGTNSAHGYKVLVSSSGTSLVNTEDATKAIETLPTLSGGYTDDSFVVNKWGIKKDSGNWNSYVSGATLLENTEPTNEDSTTISIGAKIDYTQPSGIYNLSLDFNAVANVSTSNLTIVFAGTGVESVKVCATLGDCTGTDLMGTITTSGDSVTGLLDGTTYYLYPTFTSGYELDSWANTGSYGTLSSTSVTNPGFTMGNNNGEVTLTGKQSCSSSISGNMQDFNPCSDISATSGTLTDSRDTQTYTVAKIGDNWFMTRNLAIGCNGSSSTYGSSVSSKSLTSSNSNVSSTWSTPTALLSAASSSTETADYSAGRMQCNSTYGAWYNYAAATAGTITGSENTSNATYDICPKGWRLPTNDEFTTLKNTSGSATSFSPVTGGSYDSGSLILTGDGRWWSSTAVDDTYRYNLHYVGSSLSTSDQKRYNGFYVRCIKS